MVQSLNAAPAQATTFSAKSRAAPVNAAPPGAPFPGKLVDDTIILKRHRARR